MRKVITAKQAESVHLSGGEVWFRFSQWPASKIDRSFRACVGNEYCPATLRAAYDVGGQWHHLNVGLPIYSVEVE